MITSNYKQKLKSVKTFIFDIDGVLTDGMVTLFPDGQQIRAMNIKDGFAIQYAIKKGYNVAIISRGTSETVISRLNWLGVKDIFLKINDKVAALNDFVKAKNIELDEVLYMGDDIPDYNAMSKCGVRTCPKNSAEEILTIADYVSDKKGGEGCARDIIEQTLRCQNAWFTTVVSSNCEPVNL